MLPSFSEVFAMLLNLAIKTQPNIEMTALDGRSFCVAIDELPQDIAIRVDSNKITALNETEIADVTISGNIKAIINMITDENGLDNDELYISGKIGAAKHFQHFLARFTIDWQGFFTQFMSDEGARKTADAVEQALHVAKGGVEEMKDSLKDYLIHEKKLFVNQTEFSELVKDVAKLNARLDALFERLDINDVEKP